MTGMGIDTRSFGAARLAMWAGVALAIFGCATVAPTPASLTQAQTIYATLEAEHAEQRVEGDMIRARAIIDTVRTAVAQGENATYVDGEAQIALRTAQIAEAHFGRALAETVTDSLQKLRLTRELAIARARQSALEAQRAEAELRAAAANARADSLRRAADAARVDPTGGTPDAVAKDSMRTDSIPTDSMRTDSMPTDSMPTDSSASRTPPDSARRP